MSYLMMRDIEFKKYSKIGVTEIRPYLEGEQLLKNVVISEERRKKGSPKQGDMICRDPNNTKDVWLITEAYFNSNYEEIVL